MASSDSGFGKSNIGDLANAPSTRIPAANIAAAFQQGPPPPDKPQAPPKLYVGNKMTDPSVSVDTINIPEIESPTAEFVYNFYTEDERIASPKSKTRATKKLASQDIPLDKIARYVLLTWKSPKLSDFEVTKPAGPQINDPSLSIEKNASLVISEESFFNPGYVSHTFSSVDAIEQGSSDLEKFSSISRHNVESVYKMASKQLNNVAESTDLDNEHYRQSLAEMSKDYMTLSNFPNTSLGLRVTGKNGKSIDDDGFIESITNSLSLDMKINAAVIPDVFENSQTKTMGGNLSNLQRLYTQSRSSEFNKTEGVQITPVTNGNDTASYLTQPVKLIGYIIEKFRFSSVDNSFEKIKTYYIEDIDVTNLEDKEVMYGTSYFYSIRCVAAIKLYMYENDGSADISVVYVSSKAKSISVETFEYVPPPEPESLDFDFDYINRNLIVSWNMPVNHQGDVKQFQVFRRKTIREPFELIAQYGFDNSAVGPGTTGRYRTGEIVDANNDQMPDDYRNLVTKTSGPVYSHRDRDFTVNTETFESSEYIYAVCAVDAHGMISNYSTQYHVVFDPYKNRLVRKIVCNAGSPRQYPNMYLSIDTFKDTIHISGDAAKKMNVYFTPEHLKVSDSAGRNFKVVETRTSGPSSTQTYTQTNHTPQNKNSYYVFQFLNLDNQKLQVLKVNIDDPEGLTL